MMKLRAVVLIAAGLASTGCVRAIKQGEVMGAMRDLGLSDPDAHCVASRAARQLSIRELRSLQAAAASVGDRTGSTPLPIAVLRVRDKVDPQTLATAVQIAGECVAERASRVPQ